MKYILHFILLILSIPLMGQGLILDKAEYNNYPSFQTEFYYVKDNFRPELNISKNEIQLKENSTDIIDFELMLADDDLEKEHSLVISIDISATNSKNIELIKSTLIEFLSYINIEKTSVALQTFNSKAYLNQDFTNSVDEINRAINLINTFSGTNFNAAFISEFGSANILKNADTESRAIITITDGNAAGDVDEILNSLDSPVYSITIEKSTPTILSEISEQTNGQSFPNINSDTALLNSLIVAYYKSIDFKPHIIKYDSDNCDISKNISLEIDGLNVQKEYILDEVNFPYIEISPEYYDYGIVEVGQPKTIEVELTARNSDIVINNYQPAISEFTFDNSIFNLNLKQDSTYIVELTFLPKNKGYVNRELEINSNACFNSSISVSGGNADIFTGIKTLELLHPVGGEIFYPGEEINIKWKGVLPDEELIIEHSTNDGFDWNLLDQNASGLEYKWDVPLTEGDNNLIRISKPESSNLLENVTYLFHPDKSKKVNRLSLSPNREFSAICYDDGSIVVFNNDSAKISRIIRNDLDEEITGLKWNPSTSQIAASFNKNNLNNIVIWDALDPNSTIVLSNFSSSAYSIEWDDTGSRIFAGLENGKVLKWDISEPGNPIELFDANSPIIDMSFNPFEFVTIGFEKSIKHISTSGGVYNEGTNFEHQIVNINWLGTQYLAIATEFPDAFIFEGSFSGGPPGNIVSYSNIDRFSDSEKSNIKQIEFLTKDNIAIISENENNIEIWNFESQNLLYEFEYHNSEMRFIDNSIMHVLSASDTNFAMLWNYEEYPFRKRFSQSDLSNQTWEIKELDINTFDKDLGDFCIGFSYELTINEIIVNNDKRTVRIDSVKSDDSDIFIKNIFPFEVGFDESLSLDIDLSPSNQSVNEYELFIYYGANIDTVIISINTQIPDYQILTEEVDFEFAQLNNQSVKSVELLKNISQNIINFESVEILYDKEIFDLIDNPNLQIEPGENLELNIGFTPVNQRIYSGLLKLTSTQLCSPLYIQLKGNGSAGNLSYIQNIDFNLENCQTAENDTTFYIYNFGQSEAILQSAELISNHFSISSDIDNEILAPGDSLEIIINRDISQTGTFEAELIINTNINNDVINIPLISRLDSIDLEINSSILDFGNLELNESLSLEFDIKNNSNTPVSLMPVNNQLFELDDFSEVELIPQESIKYTLNFLGFQRDTLIDSQINLFQLCNDYFNVPVFVNVNSGFAELSTAEEINLGDYSCDSSKEFFTTIKNTGNSNLILGKVSFLTNNNNAFSLSENFNDTVVAPNDSITIPFTYTPTDLGNITSFLEIISNARNADEGKSFIKFDIHQKELNFSFSNSSILIKGLREDDRYSESLILENTGSDTLSINTLNSDNFKIDSVVPPIIYPDSNAIVYITFLGGKAGTTYNEEVYIFDQCGDSKSVNMTAEVGGPDFITLNIDDININSGEFFDLVISYENTSNIVIPDADTIYTTLFFNSTLMVPTNQDFKGNINQNGLREIKLTLPLTENNNLIEIPMLATLGDTSHTEIYFSQTIHTNSNFFINDDDKATLTLTDVCETPLPRFINNTGIAFLSQNYPNPVSGNSTKVEYGIIEEGEVKLGLFDMQGYQIHELVNNYMSPGQYEQEIPLDNLSPGKYFYILETKSMKIIKNLIILR